jgi:hypothetical protein
MDETVHNTIIEVHCLEIALADKVNELNLALARFAGPVAKARARDVAGVAAAIAELRDANRPLFTASKADLSWADNLRHTAGKMYELCRYWSDAEHLLDQIRSAKAALEAYGLRQ